MPTFTNVKLYLIKPDGPTVCESGLREFDNYGSARLKAFLCWATEARKAHFLTGIDKSYSLPLSGDPQGILLWRLLNWYLYESDSAYRFEGKPIPSVPSSAEAIPSPHDWDGLDTTLSQVVSLMLEAGEVTQVTT